jgi:hypothetical protein
LLVPPAIERPVEELAIITVLSVFFVPLTVASFIPVLSVLAIYEGLTQVPSSLKNFSVPEDVGVIIPAVTVEPFLEAEGKAAVIATPPTVAIVFAVVPKVGALLITVQFVFNAKYLGVVASVHMMRSPGSSTSSLPEAELLAAKVNAVFTLYPYPTF